MYETSNLGGPNGNTTSTTTNLIVEMNSITNSSSDEHEELLAEMELIERLPTQERLKQAKRRRALQLKKWADYEKELLNNEYFQPQSSNTDELVRSTSSSNNTTRSSKRKKQRNVYKISANTTNRSIKFQDHVVLLDAIMRKDYDEVERLLISGITPNSANEDGLTAIHQCCIDDSADLLRLLISYGANVNVCDNDLWTPLHAAATCANLEICKILIENQAELLAVNTDGNMPYDICDDEVCLEFIESEMAKKGVTQQAIDMKRSETEMRMLDDLKQICLSKNTFDSSYMSDKSGLNQNNFFIYFNNTQTNDGYLDLNARDSNGATLMHIACANGYTSILEFILIDCSLAIESGAKLIPPVLSMIDNDGWTPLHVATFWGHQKAIEILLEHGADINLRTNNDETVLDLCDDPDIRDYIIQKSKEIESQQQQAAALAAMQKQMQLIYNANSISNSTNSINESLKKTNGDNSSIINNSSRSLKRTSTGVSRSSSVRRSSFRDKEKASRKFDTSFKEVLYATETTLDDNLTNIIMPAKETEIDLKNNKNLSSVVKIINGTHQVHSNPSNNHQIYDNINSTTKNNLITTISNKETNHNSNKKSSFTDDHNNNQIKKSNNSNMARIQSNGHHDLSLTSNTNQNNKQQHTSNNLTQITDTTLDNTTNSSVAVINVNNVDMNSTNKSSSYSNSVLRNNTTNDSIYYNNTNVINPTNNNLNQNNKNRSNVEPNKTTILQPVSTGNNHRLTNQNTTTNKIETSITSDVEGIKYKFKSTEPIGAKHSANNEFCDANSETASNKFTKCSKCLKRCFVM